MTIKDVYRELGGKRFIKPLNTTAPVYQYWPENRSFNDMTGELTDT